MDWITPTLVLKSEHARYTLSRSRRFPVLLSGYLETEHSTN